MLPFLYLVAILESVSTSPAGIESKPAPIPERWLLKYAPKDMPALPEAFAAKTWYHRYFPRFVSLAWEEWVAFTPATGSTPGAAKITRADRGEDDKPRLTVRTVPLAIHGRLVEYDGRLFTVGIGRWAHEQPTPTDVLDFGVAVELPGNVWYQAASLNEKGEPTRVQEWKLEFSDDPRTAKQGRATVRGFGRVVTEIEGEDFVCEVKFERTKQPHEKVWSIKLTAPEGTKLPQSGLPTLAFDLDRDRAFIFDGTTLNQMFPLLTEAARQPPQAKSAAGARLVQPPKKP
jgi:hypothetical protein